MVGGLRAVNEALATIEKQRASLKDYHLRRTLQNNKHEVYDLAVAIALEKNDSALAFSYSERSRARAFLDLMGSHSSGTPIPVCDAAGLADISSEFATVVFYERETEIIAWIATSGKNSVLRIPVGQTELRKLTAIFYRSLFSAIPDSKSGKPIFSDEWRVPAGKLHQQLWEPIEKALPAKMRVCVIPHGTLHYIPFQALFDGKTFAIERRDIFYAASGSALAHAWKNASPVIDDNILFFDPILSDDPASPFSKTETQDVATFFPGAKTFLKKDATRTVFEKTAPDAGLLHISSHGSVDSAVPLNSALLFQADGNDSGLLTAEFVYRSHFPKLGLVVMSACVSSVGELAGGDEATGMTRAFQTAGAQNTIGSLWPVENEATTALMIAFYRSLKENREDPTSSFQLARSPADVPGHECEGWLAISRREYLWRLFHRRRQEEGEGKTPRGE